MSADEEQRAAEERWESLTRDKSDYESPPWHEEILRETGKRYGAAQEQAIDWSVAKRELRKRQSE
jgi:hypothetical protein